MSKWQEIRFEDLYEIPSRNGLTRPSSVRGEGYNFINMGELFACDRIYDMETELVKLSEKEKRDSTLQEGDLLFARQSLVFEGAGKCSVVMNLKNITSFESHLIRVRLNQTIADPLFYYYYFSLPYNAVKTIVQQCAQAGVRGTDLAKIKVPQPGLPTQKRIADVLSAYDDLIENNNKRIALLEKAAQKLYKEWFVRFRFPEHEQTEFKNGIPKGWECIKIGDIISFERGISYSSDEIDCDDGVNLINLKNIEAFGGFRRDGTKKYNGKYRENQVVLRNDLVLGVTDMTQDRRTVGAVALIPTINGISVISADLVKVISDIPNQYLYCLCKYGFYSKYFAQFANGANVLHLKPNTLLNKKLLLPTKKLIDAFVEKVSVFIELIDKLNLDNDNLIKQRDLLLPRLMSGKLEV